MNAPDANDPNVRAAIAALRAAAPHPPELDAAVPCRADLEREIRLLRRQLDQLRDDVAELVQLVIPEVDDGQ